MADAGKLEKLKQRNFPWCTLILVLSATACHVCVLTGNFKTAGAMDQMGTSTHGWSRIGVGVAESLESELQHRMQNISQRLLDSLGHIGIVQDAIEAVLSMVGVEADGVLEPPESGDSSDREASSSVWLAAKRRHGGSAAAKEDVKVASAKTAALLQSATEGEGANITNTVSKLYPVVLNAVHHVLNSMVNKVSDLLAELLEKLKPALEEVGDLILKFGDKIQTGLSMFSVTVDRVQKLFDQIMAKLHGYGDNEDELLHETFNLFDVSNTGFVTTKDLQDVSRLYSITALQGSLAQKLVSKYDLDGDARLTMEELRMVVNDPAIPDSMTVVLRTYANRLAEVAGVVASARQRDEVANAVVDYLELVCAKNQTKVGWIAERLSNGSLPLEFTGDVLVELCLNIDDPNKLTTADVGANFVGKMYDLDPENTLAALELLSNSTYWLSEGFEASDQPVCVKRVTEWVTNASTITSARTSEAVKGVGDSTVTELLRRSGEVLVHHDLLKAFPAILESQCEAGISKQLMARHRDRMQQRGARFSSKTSQLLLNQLLGGASPTDVGAPTPAERAVKSGVLARPETLEFAQWLANNASHTATGFQEMCFNYSASSSNAVDSVASRIQGVVSETKGFIDMMMRYATPAAIERLEDQIAEFTESALEDVQSVIEKRVASLMGNSSDVIDAAIQRATHKAGEQLGRMIGRVVSSPFAEAIKEPMEQLMGEIVQNPKVGSTLGDKLGAEVADAVSNLTGEALAAKTGDILETVVESALDKGSDIFEAGLDSIAGKFADSFGGGRGESGLLQQRGTPAVSEAVRRLQQRRQERKKVSLLQWQDRAEASELEEAAWADLADGMQEADSVAQQPGFVDKLPAAVSGAWEAIVNLLRSLMNLIPAAVQVLKNARREVSALASNLHNTFTTFQAKGPPVFQQAASLWRMVWSAYFMFLLPLNCLLVYYAMWSGGYFGGPKPIEEEEVIEPPQTYGEKMRTCFRACSGCMRKCHDSQLGFWSVVILLEVVVLVIFAVSIVLGILGGVKVFVVQGCNEFYVLHDNVICTETLVNLRNFLGTFMLDSSMRPVQDIEIEEACGAYRLLTCDMIVDQMRTSTILTTAFSFLATLISLQLIIDSAVLHEQATFRRLANEYVAKQEAGGEQAPRPAAASSVA
mmetsp:Transcript_97086/g.274669  ORF Transcript_97086/g.274669 Transcript_97086/m.274669 type:complete len:1158 (+) Transcript_97086:91-3564(+)